MSWFSYFQKMFWTNNDIVQVLFLSNVLGSASTCTWLISLTVIPPLLPFCSSSFRSNNVIMVDVEMEDMREEKHEPKEPEIGMDAIFQYWFSFFVRIVTKKIRIETLNNPVTSNRDPSRENVSRCFIAMFCRHDVFATLQLFMQRSFWLVNQIWIGQSEATGQNIAIRWRRNIAIG